MGISQKARQESLDHTTVHRMGKKHLQRHILPCFPIFLIEDLCLDRCLLRLRSKGLSY